MKMQMIRDSALKDLITEKPPRLSRNADVYTSFLSETFFSSTAILLPVRMEAANGKRESPIATNVSKGLYHIIRTIAPMKVRELSSMEKVFQR